MKKMDLRNGSANHTAATGGQNTQCNSNAIAASVKAEAFNQARVRKGIFLIAVVILLSSCSTTRCIKDYESACVWSDIARIMIDTYGDTIYHKYTCDMDSMGLHINKEDLKDYYWGY